jgi:hypothetical protein
MSSSDSPLVASLHDAETVTTRKREVTAIRVQGLRKRHQIYNAPRVRPRYFLLPRLQRMHERPQMQCFREFRALKEISLELKQCVTVEIIGRNGSRKLRICESSVARFTQTPEMRRSTGVSQRCLSWGRVSTPNVRAENAFTCMRAYSGRPARRATTGLREPPHSRTSVTSSINQ